METKLLILPGLGDSGENHWQSYWLENLKTLLNWFKTIGKNLDLRNG